MNIHEFAEEVNKLVKENGKYKRFFLTQWGMDGKDEAYFIDEGHHGFLNGVVTLKDNILAYSTIMHDGWEIFKFIHEVAERHGITVVDKSSTKAPEEPPVEGTPLTPEQEAGIQKFEHLLSAYTEAIDSGKRVTEAIHSLDSVIEQCDNTLKGTYSNPFMGLLNASAGMRKLPQDNPTIANALLKVKEKASDLLEKCKVLEDTDPCDHDWLIEETWYNGGGILPTPPYIDMHCTKCDSSITSYDTGRNYPVWLKYLTPEQAALFPRERKVKEGTPKVYLHELVSLVLEHKDEFVPIEKTLSQMIDAEG